jgi:hypothetical protein
MANYTKIDIAALELALAQTLAEPDRVEQVTSKLRDEDRMSVAEFCSYHRQSDTLHLEPWESPPCWIDDPAATLAAPNNVPWAYGAHEAAQLVKQMQALGISKYHPDPLAAIEAAKARRT